MSLARCRKNDDDDDDNDDDDDDDDGDDDDDEYGDLRIRHLYADCVCMADSCPGAADAVAKSRGRGGRRPVGRDAVRVPLPAVQHVREPGDMEEDSGRRGDVDQHHGQHTGALLGDAPLRGRAPLRSSSLPDVTPDHKYVTLISHSVKE